MGGAWVFAVLCCALSFVAAAASPQQAVHISASLSIDTVPLHDVFSCANCTRDSDCHESLEWKVWHTDGMYVNVQVNATKLCIRSHLVGCNGATGPEHCDSRGESCVVSQNFFNETARRAKHSVCSKKAYRSTKALVLSKWLPITLTVATALIVLAALWQRWDAFYNKTVGDAAMMLQQSRFVKLVTVATAVACCGTFWSPFVHIGVAGVAAVLLVVAAHCADLPRRAALPDNQWLLLATVAALLPVAAAWFVRSSLLKGCDGSACSAFYDGYFEIDPRLQAPAHNTQVHYHSLCSRSSLARALWNVAAVVFLSFLLGTLNLVTLANRYHAATAPVEIDEEAMCGVEQEEAAKTPSMGRGVIMTVSKPPRVYL